MTFHVGQKVVCVDAAPRDGPSAYTVLPVEGCVYTVRAVARWSLWVGRGETGVGIWLDELIRPIGPHGVEHPWISTRFRPVKTTSIEIFRAMLVTPKQPVSA